MIENLPAWLQPPVVFVWLIPLLVWSIILKAMGLWKAGKNGQLGWFLGILFTYSAGLVPLLYIVFFQQYKR